MNGGASAKSWCKVCLAASTFCRIADAGGRSSASLLEGTFEESTANVYRQEEKLSLHEGPGQSTPCLLCATSIIASSNIVLELFSYQSDHELP